MLILELAQFGLTWLADYILFGAWLCLAFYKIVKSLYEGTGSTWLLIKPIKETDDSQRHRD
jgi:hypothetical protein